MQKGVFLLQMGGPETWRRLFSFHPYDWGPYSRQLSSRVSGLQTEGLLDVDPVTTTGYPAYRTTTAGEEAARSIQRELTATEWEFIRRVRRFVTTRSFTQLLRDVYKAFPEYATASRFQG